MMEGEDLVSSPFSSLSMPDPSRPTLSPQILSCITRSLTCICGDNQPTCPGQQQISTSQHPVSSMHLGREVYVGFERRFGAIQAGDSGVPGTQSIVQWGTYRLWVSIPPCPSDSTLGGQYSQKRTKAKPSLQQKGWPRDFRKALISLPSIIEIKIPILQSCFKEN